MVKTWTLSWRFYHLVGEAAAWMIAGACVKSAIKVVWEPWGKEPQVSLLARSGRRWHWTGAWRISQSGPTAAQKGVPGSENCVGKAQKSIGSFLARIGQRWGWGGNRGLWSLLFSPGSDPTSHLPTTALEPMHNGLPQSGDWYHSNHLFNTLYVPTYRKVSRRVPETLTY